MSQTVRRVCFLFALFVSVPLLNADTNRETLPVPVSSTFSGLNANSSEQGRPIRVSTTTDPLDRPLALDQTGASKNTNAPQPQSPPVGLATSTIVGGLAICLGIFLLIVLLTRRNTPNKFGPLPSEVIESLGRMTLNHRQQLQLIRLGRKLVLLNVTAQGATAICEIDDPDEVTRIAGLCQQARPNSATTTFREVLGQFGQGSEAKDYLETSRPGDEGSRGSLVRAYRPTREGLHG